MTRILGPGKRRDWRLASTRRTHAVLLAASALGLIGQAGCGATGSTQSSVAGRQSTSTGTTGAVQLPRLGETVDLQPVSLRDNLSRRTCALSATGTASGKLGQRVLGLLSGNAKGPLS